MVLIGNKMNQLKNHKQMTYKQVIALLKSNKDEVKIKNSICGNQAINKLKTYGIGLTKLRKLAKQIGKNHDLALQLWESDIYDARIIALLIDDPKQITIEQAERQVENLNQGYLAHVFSACGAPLSKTPFADELAMEWINSEDSNRRRCSYGIIYELSKSKKKSAPIDAYFLNCIQKIRASYKKENNIVLTSMGGALLGIGKRNARLNAEALKLAKKIGPIPIESSKGKCEPFNVVKHLTSDYIKEKLNLR